MNELRLGRPVELPRARILLRFAFHGRDYAVEHTRLAGALDGRDARADFVDNLLVSQLGVREQNNPSPLHAVRRHPSMRQHRLEARALVDRELNSISLHARRARRFAHDRATFHPSPGG